MTSSGDPLPVVAAAARAFDAARVPYLVAGSLASTVHGEPRGTLDVDVAADLDVAHAPRLYEVLEPEFLLSRDDVLDAAAGARMFHAIHRETFVMLDVHVRRDEGHFAEELRRARLVEHAPVCSARFAMAEDTLLRKLWWYRRGDEVSDRQWRDVLGVLGTVGAALDDAYLARWARHLEVHDLLERALLEATTGG